MKRSCPRLSCLNHHGSLTQAPTSGSIVRKGSYYRACDRRLIRRYLCKLCHLQFSSATSDPNYRQKRRDLNPKISALLCSGISQRRLARFFEVNPKTIVRKFRALASQGRLEQAQWRSQLPEKALKNIQFDELETSEHTKCKPLSVALAVNSDTREILGFQVSRMPAKGLLAKISRKKYGRRLDERAQGLNSLFQSLIPLVSPTAEFSSDENPHYPRHLKRHFPGATHVRYPGARGAITGQGELKKLKFDPLFSLNHTCAMLRANLNRLFRRTWCTTKTIQGLIDHLSLYVRYHNQILLQSYPPKGGS